MYIHLYILNILHNILSYEIDQLVEVREKTVTLRVRSFADAKCLFSSILSLMNGKKNKFDVIFFLQDTISKNPKHSHDLWNP